jgi:Zn ribbon nucleic-acid-binding protein
MSQTQSTTPLCPMCHKAMRLMLVKETGARKLRCMDCGQPDPMQSVETQAWLKGELGQARIG